LSVPFGQAKEGGLDVRCCILYKSILWDGENKGSFYFAWARGRLLYMPVDYILFSLPRAKSSIFLLKCGYGSRSGPKRKLRVE